VLVVDDSLVIRRLVTEALAADPQIDVVGVAQNGQIALRKIDELKPDAVTMDTEMPVMDGISCVREVRKLYPRLPVVMFSTLTERGAAATMDALSAGASDYVTKPSNVGSVGESKQSIRNELIPRLIALTRSRGAAPGAGAARLLAGSGTTRAGLPTPVASAPASSGLPNRLPAPGAPARPRGLPASCGQAPTTAPGGLPVARIPLRAKPFEVLVIGSSTGGPDALAALLSALPADLPVPVVVVQHMPPIFTRLLAERLNSTCPLTIVEAEAGTVLRPGTVLIAPGGRHLEVNPRGVQVIANLTDAPPENFCRPAVDVLFRSAAKTFAGNTLALVLTGMGRDGTVGATRIREAGGQVLAQDEETSVVWGMPGSLVAAGQADRVLPLPQIAPQLVAALARAPRPGDARTAGGQR
jgi:two-component system chemotaxis response regulator CheB